MAEKKKKAPVVDLKELHARAKEIGKKFDLAPVTLGKGGYVKGAVSTGALAIDLVTGGGLAPGRFATVAGPSMSGKSTLTYQSVVNANLNGIPAFYLDHETSADPKYMTALGIDLKEASGEGLFLYSPATTAENTYKYMHQMMDIFPDKNTSAFAPPQAVFIIDSFAAMIPDSVDEDPDKNMQMAAMAKIHAWGMPLIKSKLHKKNITLLGTNQIRKKPGIAYGNPEYEPGGEALTFYADLKLQARGKGKPELERGRSMRQTNITVSKNKQFPPWLKVDDMLNIALGYGFDRFYDGLAYLKLTDQAAFVKGKGAGWQITGFDHYKPLAGKKVPQEDLIQELFQDSFREACLEQMANGEAFTRLFAHLKFDELYKFDPQNSGLGDEGKDLNAEEDDGSEEALAEIKALGPKGDILEAMNAD